MTEHVSALAARGKGGQASTPEACSRSGMPSPSAGWDRANLRPRQAKSPCGRRVGNLYLPPRSRYFYFGCRRCYRLTYTSCQESRRDDGVARNMGQDFHTAKRLLNRIGKRR
jgi:hypothetical protein